MRTLSLREAAEFLHLHPEELRQRAKAGHIPGAKVGRAWVFLEDDFVAHVRSLYVSPRRTLQVASPRETPSHIVNAKRSFGSTRPLPVDKLYAELLGLPKKPSRKNSKTN